MPALRLVKSPAPKLGELVTDQASGFTGICTAICYYIGGHIRLEITPQNQRRTASAWFDASRVHRQK